VSTGSECFQKPYFGASKPIVYTTKPEDALRSEAGIAGLSPGALRATLDGLRRKMAGLSAEENGR
jgi:hypothetical protein